MITPRKPKAIAAMTHPMIAYFIRPFLVIFLFFLSLGSGDVINLPRPHANTKNSTRSNPGSILDEEKLVDEASYVCTAVGSFFIYA
ncbi:hypothetical protein GW864_01445 [bacterium]|nr:hypothetical protein [bacterium]